MAIALRALVTTEKVKGATLFETSRRPKTLGTIGSIGIYNSGSTMVIHADTNLHLPLAHTSVEEMSDGVLQLTLTLRNSVFVYEIRLSV